MAVRTPRLPLALHRCLARLRGGRMNLSACAAFLRPPELQDWLELSWHQNPTPPLGENRVISA